MSRSPGEVEEGIASPVVFASADNSDADKRERQWQLVRRSYYRKLNRLQAMREHVRRLESEYDAVLHARRQQDESAEHLLASGLPSTTETLAHLYTRLLMLRDDLRSENEALELLVKQHARFQERVQVFAREQTKADALQQTSEERDNAITGLQFKAMALDECREIAADSYQELQRFTSSRSYQSTGHQVLGWRDRRQVDDDRVKFMLTKAFRGFSSLEVLNRAWAVMTDPDGMKSMYSASMNLTVKRVQVVDDDNIVLFRVITGPDGRSQIKSLFLATRFHVGEDALLVYRSIDSKRLVELDGATNSDSPEYESGAQLSTAAHPEVWMDIFSWNVFKDLDDIESRTCEFSCGGIVPSTATTSAQMWLLEVLLLALRWEVCVVGAIFTLTG